MDSLGGGGVEFAGCLNAEVIIKYHHRYIIIITKEELGVGGDSTGGRLKGGHP